MKKTFTVFGIILFACLALIAEGSLRPAQAIECGDVIGPDQRVKLQEDLDCSGIDPDLGMEAALTVVGPAKLQLNGHTIIGNGDMDGIVVEGEKARIRRGTVTGCFNGVVVEGEGRHKILKVKAKENKMDGFLVISNNNKLTLNKAVDNQSDGFEVFGDENWLVNNKAKQSGDEGFELKGDRNKFYNNRAVANQQDSIEIDGDENRIAHNFAKNDVDDGIVINGNRNYIYKNKVFNNAQDGIEVDGDGNTVIKNKVKNNGKYGIYVEDGVMDNVLKRNRAKKNVEFDLFDENHLDLFEISECGLNTWKNNKYETSNTDCIQ
jgi:parallel beta-helix repeat protein